MTPIRFVTYNVHDCVGRDGKFSVDRIIEVLLETEADVVALQEITLDHAGDLLGLLESSTRKRVFDGTLFERGVGRYGNVLLSPFEPLEQRLHDLSVSTREPRGVLDVSFDMKGRVIRVCATHLGFFRHESKYQFEQLSLLLRERRTATVLLGDFNVWCGRKALQPLAALGFEHIEVRSYPTWLKPLLPLDRIFAVSPAVIERCWYHDTPLARIASDHYPVLADIRTTASR